MFNINRLMFEAHIEIGKGNIGTETIPGHPPLLMVSFPTDHHSTCCGVQQLAGLAAAAAMIKMRISIVNVFFIDDDHVGKIWASWNIEMNCFSFIHLYILVCVCFFP